MSDAVRGLFITGTDTGVGKTYVAAMIARSLRAAGRRVGVYKPAASGCRREGDKLVSDDALALWNAAGGPGDLEHVCPQRFAAPLAPHLAAAKEGKRIDPGLLQSGLDYWRERSEIVLVEGAGGLMSPLGETEYNGDLAAALGLPLLVVARNALGVINATLQTLVAATAFGQGLAVAGIVLNHPAPPATDDVSLASNPRELLARSVPPLLAEVAWGAERFAAPIDWFALASRLSRTHTKLTRRRGDAEKR
jgi:dethiobiotin synthetase